MLYSLAVYGKALDIEDFLLPHFNLSDSNHLHSHSQFRVMCVQGSAEAIPSLSEQVAGYTLATGISSCNIIIRKVFTVALDPGSHGLFPIDSWNSFCDHEALRVALLSIRHKNFPLLGTVLKSKRPPHNVNFKP